jgi:predicted patatin/cPLA2 family phospholipase
MFAFSGFNGVLPATGVIYSRMVIGAPSGTAVQPTVRSVTLTGIQSGEVIDLIHQRLSRGSRDDGRKLALVVEGGSMRGVYTAGSLLALHAMGLAKLFDNVYGTSAGAVNAGHFLSGRGDIKADTYYRCLAGRRFINPYRIWKVVDIDFFVDQVLTSFRPIEVSLIMGSNTPLWVSVIDYISSRPLLLHAQSGEYPLLPILKAAVALPVLYNKLIPLGQLRCFDAGFWNPFPIEEALAHGNTHLLVLLAKPEGFRAAPKPWWHQMLFRRRFALGNAELMRMFAESHLQTNHLRDLAHGRATTAGPLQPAVSIATVSPRIGNISGRSQNPATLRSEMIATARGLLQLFEHSERQIDEWIRDNTI